MSIINQKEKIFTIGLVLRFSFDCDKVKYNELKKAIFKLNDEKYIDKFQNAASILEQHK